MPSWQSVNLNQTIRYKPGEYKVKTLDVLDFGAIESIEQAAHIANSATRVMICNSTDNITAWWRCQDENSEFVYFGTPDSFEEWKKGQVQ